MKTTTVKVRCQVCDGNGLICKDCSKSKPNCTCEFRAEMCPKCKGLGEVKDE